MRIFTLKNLRFFTFLTFLLIFINNSFAAKYQLDNADFENWNSTWNGKPQPDNWELANVEQIGLKFNIGERSERAHTGKYSTLCQGTEVGAVGITAVSPSWVTLGHPWAYLDGIKVGSATAGTDGGIQFTARPDTMAVWVIRESNENEDMNLLYYAWKGESKGTKYKNKDNGCTSTTHYDEESDIRITTDANGCNTEIKATQVCEGWFKTKEAFPDWTLFKVPIKYYNNEIPEKMNIILSASRYPDFRANSGQYTSSKLWVDDVSLIYSSQVYDMRFDGLSYAKFNKDVYEYTQELADGEPIPTITCYRSSRLLSGSEITIKYGKRDGAATVITVKAEDGSSTSTYKVYFVSHRDINPEPEGILINGEPLSGFNPKVSTYSNISLPYGTVDNPKIELIKANEWQTLKVEPYTVPGTAKVTVYAQNTDYSVTYYLSFTVAELSDTTLKDIIVNGHSIQGFAPTKSIFMVTIPEGTTENPELKPVSAYPEGEQTINTKVVAKDISGMDSVVNITVSAPAATSVRVYEVIYKIAPSSYSYLNDLNIDGITIDGFRPDSTSYTYELEQDATEVPEIGYEKGESVQNVAIDKKGVGEVSKITVTAQDGVSTSVYRIHFRMPKSTNTKLKNIYIGGEPLQDFDSEVFDYVYYLPDDAQEVPDITVEKELTQQVIITKPDLYGTSIITVTAESGKEGAYSINFVKEWTSSKLSDIKVGGVTIDGFSPEKYEYTYTIHADSEVLPSISVTKQDESATMFSSLPVLDGDAIYTLISQNNDTTKYTVHFVKAIVEYNTVSAIKVNDELISGFNPMKTKYVVLIKEDPANVYAEGGDVSKTVDAPTHKRFVTPDTEEKRGMTYDLYFHYTTDSIPNNDFTEWTTPKYTDVATAVKPVGWNVPADAVGKQDVAWAAVLVCAGNRTGYAGYEITKESKTVVGLNTNEYQCPLAGMVPSVMTLGNITCNIKEACGSSVGYSGGITFRNTPDYALFYYNFKKKAAHGEGAEFAFRFFDGGTEIKKDVHIGSTTNGYKEYRHPLGLNGKTLNKMNIVVNPNGLYTGLEGGLQATTGDFSELYVDYINFEYSSKINAIKVNGVDATITGTNAEATIEPNCSGIPAIDIIGEVDDQMYDIEYGAEVEGIREIKIRSYAEDMSFTDYTLTVTRPGASVLLSDLRINGVTIEEFDPVVFDYSVTLPAGTKSLPDVTAFASGVNQVVTMVVDGSSVAVEVASGDGSEKNTYHIEFSVEKESTALDMIYLGGKPLNGFNSDVHNYYELLVIGDKNIPDLSCDKGFDSQSIEIKVSDDRRLQTIVVTAADKTVRNYMVRFDYTLSNNACLNSITIGDERKLVPSFDSETFSYNVTLPYKSTVVPSISYDKGEDTQTTIEDFTDDVNGTSTITVIAEDNVTRNVYSIKFNVAESDVNTLEMIYYNNIEIEEFTPDDNLYDVVLPYGTESAPDVTYIATEPENEKVEVSTTKTDKGWQTELKIIPLNGTPNKYVVDFIVEPDRENRLKAIYVFGKLLEGFNPDVNEYNIELEAYSDSSLIPTIKDLILDPYSPNAYVSDTIQQSRESIVISVMSKESKDVRNYIINTTIKISDNSNLNAIYYKGVVLEDFDPNVYEYTYKLPFGAAFVDEDLITYDKQEDAQMVKIQKSELSSFDFIISVYSQEDVLKGADKPSGVYFLSFVPDDFDPTTEPTASDVCVTSTQDGGWKFTTKCRNVFIVLRDLNGGFLDVVVLPLVDPNCESICDAKANGYVYYGHSGKVVIYNFIYANKKRFATGKFKCF